MSLITDEEMKAVITIDLEILAALKKLRSEQYLKRLPIKIGSRVILLSVDLVEWIEVTRDGKYLIVHSAGNQYEIRESMATVEGQLDPRQFVRISKSVTVNIDHIQEIEMLSHGDRRVWMKDGTRLQMSRHFRKQVESLLGQPL